MQEVEDQELSGLEMTGYPMINYDMYSTGDGKITSHLGTSANDCEWNGIG